MSQDLDEYSAPNIGCDQLQPVKQEPIETPNLYSNELLLVKQEPIETQNTPTAPNIYCNNELPPVKQEPVETQIDPIEPNFYSNELLVKQEPIETPIAPNIYSNELLLVKQEPIAPNIYSNELLVKQEPIETLFDSNPSKTLNAEQPNRIIIGEIQMKDKLSPSTAIKEPTEESFEPQIDPAELDKQRARLRELSALNRSKKRKALTESGVVLNFKPRPSFFDKSRLPEFIQDFKSNCCLWDNTNENLKVTALSKLASKYNMTEDQTKKKINALRATYSVERKKFEKSGGTYKPIYWFHDLDFIADSIGSTEPYSSGLRDTKLLEFIAHYKSLECLWNPNCEDFKSKTARNVALRELALKYNMPKDRVEKKISHLRDYYTRESNRVKCSGGTYKPVLYWFHQFEFVEESVRRRGPRNPISSESGLSDKKLLKLIEDYKQAECLWNHNCEEFKSKTARSSSLQQLGVKYKMSEDSVEKKIAQLRNYYTEENNRMKRRGRACKPRFYWFHHFDFLAETIQRRGPKKKKFKEESISDNEIDESNLSETEREDFGSFGEEFSDSAKFSTLL